jgi:hypothetical protein
MSRRLHFADTPCAIDADIDIRRYFFIFDYVFDAATLRLPPFSPMPPFRYAFSLPLMPPAFFRY